MNPEREFSLNRAVSKSKFFPVLLLLLGPFSERAAEFPVPYNSEPDLSGPMPALEAAAKM